MHACMYVRTSVCVEAEVLARHGRAAQPEGTEEEEGEEEASGLPFDIVANMCECASCQDQMGIGGCRVERKLFW